MDPEDRLRHTIVQTLSGHAALKINFHCGTRIVNRSLFNQVVDRLTKKKLHIDSNRSDLEPGSAAEYSSSSHTFFFKSPFFGQTQSEQGIIAHESVHAGFDVIGHGGRFRSIDNEPSAYLAECFFLLNSGFSFHEIREVLELQLAFTIAMNMQSKKQSSVSPDDLVLLRNGIARRMINEGTEKDKLRFGTDKNKFRGIPP